MKCLNVPDTAKKLNLPEWTIVPLLHVRRNPFAVQANMPGDVTRLAREYPELVDVAPRPSDNKQAYALSKAGLELVKRLG
jgi:hypothetical protein